ncbi:divalent-cation tolerance protein CutA [Luteimonas viscosa]|uniref:Divalent-cation tolerance protein CutA n=1 Tax=Luteimonas viscosa TaxID=1132694 RepID=A0A5D4XN03_9GAMM|nr:divalent-cation tolerance protein CutA [Luteimonas viscosa]TYT26058.1 divalent-cation tolerance protein CutA [Luteimonas viscosa]
MTAVACFCTCPDAGTAGRIADALVVERLAACVNILPGITSVYRWQGAVERADEVLLVVKTMRARLEALTARVVALHPYELPEVIAVDIAGGLPGYLDWIAAETRPGADE